jgi:hypothetical protein
MAFFEPKNGGKCTISRKISPSAPIGASGRDVSRILSWRGHTCWDPTFAEENFDAPKARRKFLAFIQLKTTLEHVRTQFMAIFKRYLAIFGFPLFIKSIF